MAAIPSQFYGVRSRIISDTALELAAEELTTLGYAVVDSGLSDENLDMLSGHFDDARQQSDARLGGREYLTKLDEQNTLRCPLRYDRLFMDLALSPVIYDLAKHLIGPYVTLSQQNGVINPGNQKNYNQGLWHRDLPYQHVYFSRPLAINALFCLDDFTSENGSTFVLPATHKQEDFPSERFVERHAKQITAKRGSFLVLDCMIFHSGGVNTTSVERRGVNHVLTTPLLRQQINLPSELGPDYPQTAVERQYLGYEVETPTTVPGYIDQRRQKN